MKYEIGQKVHFVHLKKANKATVIGSLAINSVPAILLQYKKNDFVTPSDCLKTQAEMDLLVEIGAVKITNKGATK